MREDARVYLAPEGFEKQLAGELGGGDAHGRLILGGARPEYVSWAQDIWFEPRRIAIESISDGAKKLRALGRSWSLFPTSCHRRAALIRERLPKVKKLSLIDFPEALPDPGIGAWTLLSEREMLASPSRWKIAPHGVMEFNENKSIPPNRAYLKLWEAFTLMGERPASGDFCLDLGSSPGGWTWVLQTLGAQVLAVDKADLDPRVARLPRVSFERRSAFSLRPADFGSVDWLCCDVACYPRRLFETVSRWLDSGRCRNFVCTVKLQGTGDLEATRDFRSIPGSQLLHLYHNKHELTWIWPAREALRQDFAAPAERHGGLS